MNKEEAKQILKEFTETGLMGKSLGDFIQAVNITLQENEDLKKPKYIIDMKTNKITKLTNDFVSKDKIRPIQIIDLDGKIHNVYEIKDLLKEN